MPLDRLRLRKLRELKGLRQEQLVGVSQFSVSQCENHGTDSIALLEKLAAALDCSESFLLGRGFKGLDLDKLDDVRTVVRNRERLFDLAGIDAAQVVSCRPRRRGELTTRRLSRS